MKKETHPSIRNKTIRIPKSDCFRLDAMLLRPSGPLTANAITDKIICNDLFQVIDFLPDTFADLLFLDPPYNLDKNFNGMKFSSRSSAGYLAYLESWFPKLLRTLKPTASVYLCGDWHSAAACSEIMEKYLILRNRITWQREKGRGAASNWKNACEDIWFATVSQKYRFHAEAVRQRRKVIAPYRQGGKPKDWQETPDGRFRDTCASNFWDDISVPYWSMPENTEHPTQKPEKLLAKLILSGTDPGDVVLDPFLGSGTTAVTARKLGRRFCGIEVDPGYCRCALTRLERADADKTIQGYSDGVFWERNTRNEQLKQSKKTS